MAEDFIPAFVLPDSQSKDWPIDPNAKRIEINEFVPDKCMTNLFLLALKSMKEDPLDNPFSYYNLSSELWACCAHVPVLTHQPFMVYHSS